MNLLYGQLNKAFDLWDMKCKEILSYGMEFKVAKSLARINPMCYKSPDFL
jgi:hypothetical protein